MPDPGFSASGRPPVIRKSAATRAAVPTSFTWDDARRALDGLPGGALNIGHEAVDRHAHGARADHVAIHWLGAQGADVRLTYRALLGACNRFANAVTQLGLQRGDRLFVLAPRLPQLYVAVLGGLKAGLVVSPLFSAFGPEPIATRMNLGAARALVTTATLYRRKVEPVRAQVPSLAQVLLIPDGDDALPPDTLDFDALLRGASEDFATVATRPDEAALLHFTSGTTGKPKGALHVHDAVVMHYATGLNALDLHADDIFWCTADPGWVTGMSYGIIAPLVHGVTLVPHPAGAAGDRLVHRADSHPHADEGRRRAGPALRLPGAALHRQRRRAAQPRGRLVGPGRVRPADPRQLVADRDGRHHDRQHAVARRQARLDGPAAARRPGLRRRTARSGWCARHRRARRRG
jgi:acetyl-CoA synthetase